MNKLLTAIQQEISAPSNHRCFTGVKRESMTLQSYIPDQEVQKIKHQPSALGFSLGL